jgi:hypothetical protein
MLDLLDQVEKNLARTKVGIVEFCESPEYCNKPLYPRQQVLLKLIFLEEMEGWEEDVLDYWINGGRMGSEIQISPNIRERRDFLRANGFSHFREVVLAMGRRASKGFVTGQALAKVMWDTHQLQDPGRFYGIDPDKNIYFSCVAGSEGQAKEFQYADFSAAVESCVAFQPYIANSLETEFRVSTSEDMRRISQQKNRGGKMTKDMAKLRGKALAANAGTLRGSATMALVIDEMAHMIEGESKASADQVYGAATPALDQFGADGMIFCNSSPFSKVGMFYERHQEFNKVYDPSMPPGAQLDPSEVSSDSDNDQGEVNGAPYGFSFRAPSWALFEGYKANPKYPKRWKKAITVSPDWSHPLDPDYDAKKDTLSEDDHRRILVMRSEERANPEKFKVERRGMFAEVTDAYLNPAMVDRIFMGRPGRKDDGSIIYMGYETNYGFHANPTLNRYKAHLDPSSTTAGFGFALGHSELLEDTMLRTSEHVVFDIVKRWNPKDFPGETIRWQTVIDEVMLYAKIFQPYEITFDQFQSVEPIQHMNARLMQEGLSHIRVYQKQGTSEQNWYRAEAFKTAINHGLVHAPADVTEMKPYGPDDELKFLQQKNTGGKNPKVEKQDVGPVQTKDMADCMFEVVNALIGNVMAQNMRETALSGVMAPGSMGGYQIGGQQRPSLEQLHPDLAGYYSGHGRSGEQRRAGPGNPRSGPRTGAGRRGMNRVGRGRSRGF